MMLIVVEYSIEFANLVLWKNNISCVERNQICFVEENLLEKKLEVLYFVEFCGNLMSPMRQNHHVPHQVMVMVCLN